MVDEIISISVPPFPDFIEGDFQTFKKGEAHPDREGLGYFDLIVMKKGSLFIQEEETEYKVTENDLFILLPDKHHFSWKACEEETSFYWLHFYTTAQWKQSDRPWRFISTLPIPDLHYHQQSYTLHLPKQAKVKEPKMIFEFMQEILDSTVKVPDKINDIWKTEELFLRFLKYIENQGVRRDRLTVLAEKIQLFLEHHFEEAITNKTLEDRFHLHSNYIATAMKSAFGKTALEVLSEIRIEHAKQYLLSTDIDIQTISKITGYNSQVYFSNRFKQITGYSPQKYRDKYEKK